MREDETPEGGSSESTTSRGSGSFERHSETIASRLAGSSRLFARSAAEAYASEEWEVFYLHLATAVEHALKAVLAQGHPSFIADPSASFDTLLHLSGMGHKAKTPDFVAGVKTISAATALKRIEYLVDDYQRPGPRVRLLLDLRNAIAHVGHRPKGEAEATLAEVAEYLGYLLPAIGTAVSDYWGNWASMVADHVERRLTALEAAYGRKIQAAKDEYRRRTEGMDEVGLAAYVTAVAPAAMSAPYESAPLTCPACGHLGEVTGNPDPNWEADWDVEGSHGEPYVSGAFVGSIGLDVSYFECRVCGLRLDGPILQTAGLASVSLKEADDFDVSDASAFFEAQQADSGWDW